MHIERLGVDGSVAGVFPPERLLEALEESPVDAVDLRDHDVSLEDCQAVVTLEHRDAFVDLEWVHSIQAGVDRFPHDRFREAGVTLTNSTGVHSDAVGETVAGLVLSLARRLHKHAFRQVDREWEKPDWDESWTVAGERACVIGLGVLGRGIADRLSGLGLDVVGVRRTPLPEAGVRRVYPSDELVDAVTDARFVVLAVPLTDATHHLVDETVFEAMRSDAYLVNVARGGVVDEPALIEALRTEQIAGAALDVFEEEPLPESSPLWDLEDVIVTAHSSGHTRDYYRHVAAIVRESLRRIEAGEDPVNTVL